MADSNDLPVKESSIPGLPADWPQQATERIVGFVDQARSKTSGPAIKGSRAIVYGVVAALAAIFALPLLLIGITRGLIVFIDYGVWFIPNAGRDTAVYITYFLIGGFFSAAGLLAWSRRPAGAARPRPAS